MNNARLIHNSLEFIFLAFVNSSTKHYSHKWRQKERTCSYLFIDVNFCHPG